MSRSTRLLCRLGLADSSPRDACVLRVVGNRIGPVLARTAAAAG